MTTAVEVLAEAAEAVNGCGAEAFLYLTYDGSVSLSLDEGDLLALGTVDAGPSTGIRVMQRNALVLVAPDALIADAWQDDPGYGWECAVWFPLHQADAP